MGNQTNKETTESDLYRVNVLYECKKYTRAICCRSN